LRCPFPIGNVNFSWCWQFGCSLFTHE
jgi:hypothetical protein